MHSLQEVNWKKTSKRGHNKGILGEEMERISQRMHFKWGRTGQRVMESEMLSKTRWEHEWFYHIVRKLNYDNRIRQTIERMKGKEMLLSWKNDSNSKDMRLKKERERDHKKFSNLIKKIVMVNNTYIYFIIFIYVHKYILRILTIELIKESNMLKQKHVTNTLYKKLFKI